MDPTEVLTEWLHGIRIDHVTHSRAAAWCTRMGRILGIPVVVFAVVVGTTIFATLTESPNVSLRVAAGLLSMLAAVLSGVQTFLDYSGRAQQHHQAAVGYSRLRKEVEEFLSFDSQPDDQKQFMQETRAKWDALKESSLDVSQAIYDKASLMTRRKGH